MHPGEEGDVQREARPGITAVLAACADLDDLDGTVLDLAAVLDGLVNDHFEIIVVALAQSDLLAEQLVGLRARRPDLPLRVLDGAQPGKAVALAAGFAAATYDLILVTTADGQFEVGESNHLFEAIEQGADLAVGYRPRRADGPVRGAQGWAWNALVRALFGRTGRDVDCPVKLFRRSVWFGLGLEVRPLEPTPLFNAEFLVRTRRQGFRVVEVPLSHHRARAGSVSGAPGASEIGRALVDLLELRRSLNRPQPATDGSCQPISSGRQAA